MHRAPHSRRGGAPRRRFRCPLGGGTNKLVAKMAVEVAKPKPDNNATGVHIVAPGEEVTFLKRFSAGRDSDGRSVSSVTRPSRAGLRTVNDVLRSFDFLRLIRWFGDREGAMAATIACAALTAARSRGTARQKSMSREETFSTDIQRLRATIERELFALVVARRYPICAPSSSPRHDSRED